MSVIAGKVDQKPTIPRNPKFKTTNPHKAQCPVIEKTLKKNYNIKPANPSSGLLACRSLAQKPCLDKETRRCSIRGYIYNHYEGTILL